MVTGTVTFAVGQRGRCPRSRIMSQKLRQHSVNGSLRTGIDSISSFKLSRQCPSSRTDVGVKFVKHPRPSVTGMQEVDE